MSNRNTKQRREILLSVVAELGEVSVDDLSSQFETSKVTIRKDLAALEQQGLLLRKFGGASALPDRGASFQPTSAIKQKIADLAASLIPTNRARIIIDSGETTTAMIPALSSKKGLVVMTNSLRAAEKMNALAHPPTLLMTGGTWDPHSESFQGQVAEQVLRCYDFDQLFIGADGIDPDRGTTTFNELVGLSNVMADVAKQIIVVAESSKVGRRIPNVELQWKKIDILVTDDGLPADIIKKLEDADVQVVCAAAV